MTAFRRNAIRKAATAQDISDARAAEGRGGNYFVYPQDLSADYCFSIKTQKYSFRPKKDKETEVKTHYFLPIPSALTDNFGINYTTPELGAVGGAVADIGASVASNLSEAGSARELGRIVTQSIAGLATSAMDAAKNMDGASAMAAINAAIGNQGRLGSALSGFLGEVPNPNVTAFFKGVELKNHTFTWEMYPQSESESNILHRLINELRRDSLPERAEKPVPVATGGGGTDVMKGVGSTKTIITPFLKYPLEAHCAITTKGGQNTIIFKPAFITTISVNYAPGGPAFLHNGQPAGVSLTLGFKEQDIWTKGDYGSTGALSAAKESKEFPLMGPP